MLVGLSAPMRVGEAVPVTLTFEHAGAITVQVGEGEAAYEKTVRITRAHLEEDAGKSLHEDFHGMSGIDLNRAGTPLLPALDCQTPLPTWAGTWVDGTALSD